MLLGLPLYGYVSKSSKTSLTGSFAPTETMSLIGEPVDPPEGYPKPLSATVDGEDSAGKHFLNGAHPRAGRPTPDTSRTDVEGTDDNPAHAPDVPDPTGEAAPVSAASMVGVPGYIVEEPRVKVQTNGTKFEAPAAAATANLTSWYGQQIPFSSILGSGALKRQSDGTYVENGGFTQGWDDCSDTPVSVTFTRSFS
jgi:chitinase